MGALEPRAVRLHALTQLHLHFWLSLLLAIFPIAVGGYVVHAAPDAGHPLSRVMVTPTRIEADLLPGVELPPIRVANEGAVPVRIRAYLGEGGHDLDGMPLFRDEVVEDRIPIQLFPREFDLPAGQHREVSLKVNDNFDGVTSLYPIVYIEVQPEGSSTGSISRLAVLTLLKGPFSEPKGELLDVQAVESAKGNIKFRLLMKNTGTSHFSPEGFLSIRGPAGTTKEYKLAPVVILPGCARYLDMEWEIPRDGQYLVQADAALGQRSFGTVILSLETKNREIASAVVISGQVASVPPQWETK